MFNYSFTAVSQNRKTGNIAVTSTSSASCPAACPFVKTVAEKTVYNGCYADYSYTGIAWRKLDKQGQDFKSLLVNIRHMDKGAKLRLNVMGDLPHNNQVIDANKVNQLADTIANRKIKTILYTHHDLTIDANLTTLQNTFDKIHVNASCESVNQAKRALDSGLNAVMVMPLDSPKHQRIDDLRVVQCPAEYNDKITCSNCMLCAKDRTQNRVVIGFTAHGTAKTKVSKAVIEANRKYQTKA